MRRLIILGAGIYQVPLIRKAREMGLDAIVVSYAGNYPGFALASRSYEVDTRDSERVLEIARSEGADGIVTTGTDVAVRTIGRVCEAMDLPGIPELAARTLTDKALMKRAFLDGGVSTSPFEVVHDEREAVAAAARLGYPVMVKACDVSGSRGVTKVSSEGGMAAACAASVHATKADHFVVEKFVPGTEIGVDAFVSGGRAVFVAPHAKFVRHAGDVTIPLGHRLPYDGGPELRAKVEREVDRVIAATGMDECAFNGDFMVTPDGDVSVIEVGGRCGATCIPELISASTGIDYYAQMIHAAMGEPTDFCATRNAPCMAKLLFSDVDGTVSAIDLDRIAAIERDSGASVSLDVVPGDRVRRVCDGTDRYGQVIMETSSERDLDRVLGLVSACVGLE